MKRSIAQESSVSKATIRGLQKEKEHLVMKMEQLQREHEVDLKNTQKELEEEKQAALRIHDSAVSTMLVSTYMVPEGKMDTT